MFEAVSDAIIVDEISDVRAAVVGVVSVVGLVSVVAFGIDVVFIVSVMIAVAVVVEVGTEGVGVFAAAFDVVVFSVFIIDVVVAGREIRQRNPRRATKRLSRQAKLFR